MECFEMSCKINMEMIKKGNGNSGRPYLFLLLEDHSLLVYRAYRYSGCRLAFHKLKLNYLNEANFTNISSSPPPPGTQFKIPKNRTK